MGYHFSADIRENSYILLGDTSGSVIVIAFNSLEKGPFKHFPGQDFAHHRYDAVLKVGKKNLGYSSWSQFCDK